MFYSFRFESECHADLSRVPLHVRMKLDVTGIKISLKDWLAFSFEERNVLCHLPIETADEAQAFAYYLDFLSRKYCGKPVATTTAMNSTLWESSNRVPELVAASSRAGTRAVTLEEWRHWNFFQRYALYKTAVSKHQPEQFFALLQELRESKG